MKLEGMGQLAAQANSTEGNTDDSIRFIVGTGHFVRCAGSLGAASTEFPSDGCDSGNYAGPRRSQWIHFGGGL